MFKKHFPSIQVGEWYTEKKTNQKLAFLSHIKQYASFGSYKHQREWGNHNKMQEAPRRWLGATKQRPKKKNSDK